MNACCKVAYMRLLASASHAAKARESEAKRMLASSSVGTPHVRVERRRASERPEPIASAQTPR